MCFSFFQNKISANPILAFIMPPASRHLMALNASAKKNIKERDVKVILANIVFVRVWKKKTCHIVVLL